MGASDRNAAFLVSMRSFRLAVLEVLLMAAVTGDQADDKVFMRSVGYAISKKLVAWEIEPTMMRSEHLTKLYKELFAWLF